MENLIESTGVDTTVDSLDFIFDDRFLALDSGDGGWMDRNGDMDIGGGGVVIEFEQVQRCGRDARAWSCVGCGDVVLGIG